MVIFDCNGVLVDSEAIASTVLADALTFAGFPVSVDLVARQFHGRRAADVFATVEAAVGRKLPRGFAATVNAQTVRRLRSELRAVPHVIHALNWLRGPKAVASSATLDRILVSLEVTDLLRFFQSRLFSSAEVPNGKPAPDLYLLAASRMHVDPADCIVVEDSAAGITAAARAGMTPVGFVGRSHAPERLAKNLVVCGARAVVADMRELNGTIAGLRG